MGQRLVPFQIQAEWVQYQQIFQGQMEMMSSYLARSAKAEKSRLKRIAEDLGELAAVKPIPAGTREQRKAELRARMSGRPISPNIEEVS